MDITVKSESNTKIVGDFNTPLIPVDRSSRQQVNKETLALNDTLDQIDLKVLFTPFHLKAAEYTFFSSAHGTFSRIDYMLSHKTSLSKFKKIEIVLSVFSEHKAIILENNY